MARHGGRAQSGAVGRGEIPSAHVLQTHTVCTISGSKRIQAGRRTTIRRGPSQPPQPSEPDALPTGGGRAAVVIEQTYLAGYFGPAMLVFDQNGTQILDLEARHPETDTILPPER